MDLQKGVFFQKFQIILCFCVGASFFSIAGSEPLNAYVQDYQAIDHDLNLLRHQHGRVKRALDSELHWKFRAYGREFDLVLRPVTSAFASNHMLHVGSEKKSNVDISFIYQGHVKDIPGSFVHLTMTSAGVSSHVTIPGQDTYHIEPAQNYVTNGSFHTIIYPESKMVFDPFKSKRQTSCGDTDVFEKLRSMAQPIEWQETDDQSEDMKHHAHQGTSKVRFYEYTRTQQRNRRQAQTGNLLDPDKSTCFVSLRADQLLYNHILNKYTDSADLTRAQQAQEEILATFASYVTALNQIYTDSSFNDTANPSRYFKGIRFQLQRTAIITECGSNWANGYCTDNLGVTNYLDLVSLENHDEFCLVYTFTYRDFVQGRVGLAWVATPQSRRGGLCDKYGDIRTESGAIVAKSLNTGIVTLLNFGTTVPARVGQLTFAHEVGHNFGSEHDISDECAPFGTNQPNAADGNYIMFYSTTQGNLPNNDKFSSCTGTFFFNVLLGIVDGTSGKTNCLQSSETSFCGNTIVEDGEQCDCGYESDCASVDTCCLGRSSDGLTGCTLKASAVCSPLDGPCCKSNCEYFGSDHECSPATECTANAFCPGSGASCPAPVAKPNYQDYCFGYTRVCENGDCLGSLCRKIGWVECYLTAADGASTDQMCFMSCKQTATSECISSNDAEKLTFNPSFKALVDEILNLTQSTSTKGVSLGASATCNNQQGYCDSQGICRDYDRGTSFGEVFNEDFLNDFVDWVEEYWWAVMLMAIGLVILLGIFIKVFKYDTPSVKPKDTDRLRTTDFMDSAYAGGKLQAQPHKMPGVYSVQDQGRHYRPQGQINRAYQPSSTDHYSRPYSSSHSDHHNRPYSSSQSDHQNRPYSSQSDHQNRPYSSSQIDHHNRPYSSSQSDHFYNRAYQMPVSEHQYTQPYQHENPTSNIYDSIAQTQHRSFYN